ANAVGAQIGRRFHRDETEQLEEMILYHVAQGPGGLIITGTVFHAQRFRGGDLNVVDEARVPKWLEDRVRKTQDQNILCRLLPKKVIDPISLIFRKGTLYDTIEVPCRFEIGAEWFLKNDARPASLASLVQSGFLQILHNRFELIRRSREVEEPIAASPALLVKPVEALREFL